ncbi:MAG: mannose-1-phosphate guanylyltransferase/mannose-6-phosphate isomerase [Pseudomonadota bacterium]
MLIPVILSGGAGTRLWPVSREAHPKPFMKLADGQSLLQKTFIRAAALEGVQDILTITNREYYFQTRDEYEAVRKTAPNAQPLFLLEPMGRNTAPAIALGAFQVAERFGSDALMLVLAADHLIENQQAFAEAVERAAALAGQGKLVTFGIVPDAPETGFGYIECGAALDQAGSFAAACFVEKPGEELAREYLASGRYLWNSGMFCFAAGAILDQLRRHAPAIYEGAASCWEATLARAGSSPEMAEIDRDSFAQLTDISIDYAVMEKSADVAVVPGSFGWSDIGSWNALGGLTPPDDAGNSVIGEAVLVGVSNSFIQSEDRMVAAIGVNNLIIVDTPDALLVADRDRAQDVKKVVQQLKLMEHESYKLHRTVHRPWGTYTTLEEGDRFKIKRIVVKPGASLSLQMHYHRSEHWVVVSGTAKVVNGESTFLVRSNESTFIPAGHRHRLENPGLMDLVMIEVQSGDYVGEDDIVRFDDKYGRAVE